MKTLTKNNFSIYVFDDNKSLTITSDKITVGEPIEFIIDDCNSNNTVLHNNVTPPDDWIGHKYTFDGTTWTLNPDWVDPDTISEE